MILLIVWDGLRPDMITSKDTPFLHRMAEQGVFCKKSHAAFPTSTRVNSASLTTGCYPGRHGIVDNELYVPDINAEEAVSCADWNVLQTMSDVEGRRVVDVPTLGELLQKAGKSMASAGSGSPGTTFLTNPTVTGPVVNWATAWPATTREDIDKLLGSFLGPESTSEERNAFVIRSVTEYLVPRHRPDLLTIWLTEPDHTFHERGLASPEAAAVLAELDRELHKLVCAVEGLNRGDDLTCLLLSDHGFNTVSQEVDIDQRLAWLGSQPNAPEIVRTSNSLYLRGRAPGDLDEVIRFLQGEPWTGALFLRDDLLKAHDQVMPQSAVFGSHRRSGEIMFAHRWSTEVNNGVPGCVAGPPSLAATHGSASPYAINNCLVAWGAGIEENVVSTAPCGIVDVAPTVLHLLGIEPPDGMDGRTLHEILQGGPLPEELAVSKSAEETTYLTLDGCGRQMAWYSIVQGHRYLDQVSLTF